MLFVLALLIPIQNPLEAAVRVNPGHPSSGTVVRVERHGHKFHSYILSTGHMSNAVGETAYVEFFYKDGEKLDKPLRVKGKVVYKIDSHDNGKDFSVIKIKTGFRPAFIPIAKKAPAFPFVGKSMGCDAGSEPKSYSVLAYKTSNIGLVTIFNTPYPGRSGGGLIVNGELVAVCWGGFYICDDGFWSFFRKSGLFTTHDTITKHLLKSKYAFLLP